MNPAIVRLSGPRGYDMGQTLVISGFPRSGTTWLAELFRALPRAGILFEPLNPLRVKAAADAHCDWQNFRSRTESWPEGEAFLDEVLRGRVINAWTTCETPISGAWGVRRWIVKLVNSNAMLPWMVGRFPVPRPVLLMRHPCAVYASWVRRGWPILSHIPFEGSRFYEVYPEFEPVVQRLRYPEEYFAALWCVDHYPALRELRPSEYQLCFYERLVTEGATEVERLLKNWNIPMPQAIYSIVNRPSAKASADLQSGSPAQLRGWQRHVAADVVGRIIDVLHEFGFGFYGPGPDPLPAAVPGAKSPRRCTPPA